MKIIKLFLLVFLSNGALISIAQKSLRYDMLEYYLYSSDDKVYLLEKCKWEPVFYEETVLRKKSIIKTNAPFTVWNRNRIFYCPASKNGQFLEELIDKGGVRNKQKERRVIKASYGGLDFVWVRPKQKYHYLLLGLKGCPLLDSVNVDVKIYKDGFETIKKQINLTMRNDTNNVEGYHKILFDDNETVKDSILHSLKAISECAKGGDKVLIYIALCGASNKDGKYQFLTSESKYDSLKCDYTKTISLDTINAYVNKLEKMGVRACIYIDTNDTKSLIQNLSSMNTICTHMQSYLRSNSFYAHEIVRNWDNMTNSSSRSGDDFHSHYFIIYRRQ